MVEVYASRQDTQLKHEEQKLSPFLDIMSWMPRLCLAISQQQLAGDIFMFDTEYYAESFIYNHDDLTTLYIVLTDVVFTN